LTKKNKNLVFSSVGDYSNHHQWLKGKSNFDLYLINYSNNNSGYKNDADYYFERKGSKFQNFYFLYKNHRDVLDQYDRFLLLDDDIRFSGASISKLFDIHKKFYLSIAQPAFTARSKISYLINLSHPRFFLRYTNFVEENAPLFTKQALYKFMESYDPILPGYGIDLWFINVIGTNEKNIAIIDDIICTNPYDIFKRGNREIDKLVPRQTRVSIWNEIKYNLRIDPVVPTIFSYLKQPFYKLPKRYFNYYFNSILNLVYRIITKLVKVIYH